jgi:hypothetical protein
MQGLNATALNGVARAALLGESEKKIHWLSEIKQIFSCLGLIWFRNLS